MIWVELRIEPPKTSQAIVEYLKMRQFFATWNVGSLPADGRARIQPGDGGQRHCCQRPGSSLCKGTRNVLRIFWDPEISDSTIVEK